MKYQLLPFVLLSIFVTQAQATPITGALTGLSSPATLIDFGNEDLAHLAPVTTQFAGVTFGSDGDGWAYRTGTTAATIVDGHLIRASTNQAITEFSMLFDSDVSEAMFNFKAFTSPIHDWTMSSWLGGTLVETVTFDNVSNNGLFYGFIDSHFDEVRFQNLHDDAGFELDNLQFSTVPEPATLALFGIGLVGMGLVRRRKKV